MQSIMTDLLLALLMSTALADLVQMSVLFTKKKQLQLDD